MTDAWMEHPSLVVWFDDLEDAVSTAFALTDKQRAEVKAPNGAFFVPGLSSVKHPARRRGHGIH